MLRVTMNILRLYTKHSLSTSIYVFLVVFMACSFLSFRRLKTTFLILNEKTNRNTRNTPEMRNFTTENYKWQSLMTCQKLRLQRLEDGCRSLGLRPNKSLAELTEDDLQHMLWDYLIDEKHNLILKTIPKTGCTSWRTLFVENSQDIINLTESSTINIHNKVSIQKEVGVYTLPEYNKLAILNRILNYKLVTSVRHPMVRLESAFLDKVLHWRSGSDREVNESTDAMFEKYLTADRVQVHANRHYNTYVAFAHVCSMPYNYIIKTETATLEMQYFAEEIFHSYSKPVQMNKSINVKKRDISLRGGSLLPFFSRLKDPQGTISQLMEIYGDDMKLFGYAYEIRQDGVYAVCENYSLDGQCC